MDESTSRPRHPDSIGQAFLWALLPTFVLVLIAPAVGDAQVAVTTSITSTTGAGNLGTTITHAGNLYDITGGTRPQNGPNLFHSFGDFSVGGADIANFLNNTGLQTSNIIGRVTGGNISNIDSTIQTTGFGNANLFLVNPSGFVFGPHGSLNVTGSVSFTTAQYLRLFDGVHSANFYANPANDGLANSVLAVAPVVDFGFLSPAAYGFLTPPDPSATITVQGSSLSVLASQSISLVGGQVVIQGATLPDGTVQPAHLLAPNGSILLTSAASPGEFDVATLQSLPNVNGTSFTSFGSVSLLPGSSIDVSGARTVFVKGGQLVLSVNDSVLTTSSTPGLSETISLSPGSSIMTSNSGTDPGADIQLIASNVQLNGATMSSATNGAEPGGNIVIEAGNVHLDGASTLIITGTSGPGHGGDVRMTADGLTLNRSRITTATSLLGLQGGDLVLNVGKLDLLGGARIRSTIPTGPGVGGAINITVQGTTDSSVVLSGGSQITSDAALTSGGGGQISIRANSLDLDGASKITSTTSATGTDLNGDGKVDTGQGGDIVVSVQHLSVVGGAAILSSTLNAAAGGTMTVQGLEGPGSQASSVLLSGPNTSISSTSNTFGAPGDLTVNAGTLTITNGAAIAAGSSVLGPVGNVTVSANSIVISADGSIFSRSFAQDAGKVTIKANELTLDKGSIETTTSSQNGGRGGDVVLDVGAVSLKNGAIINSQTGNEDTHGGSSSGRAGDITMTVGTLSLANGSRISSASVGTAAIPDPEGLTTEPPGTAGNVTISATGSFMSDASSIATSAEANHGGDISITAHSVQLSGGTLITANSKAPLEVTKLVLDQNSQLIPQVVGDGNAGNITIHSGSTFLMNNSSVTTEASQASGGQVVITAPNMVQLVNSQVSTSVGGVANQSDGGNITIDPQFVVLQNSQVIAQANAGAGGAITITATSAFIADPLSIVDASSTLGINGTVNIQAPLQNVGGELTALTQEFSSAAALLAQQCAARAADGKFSTFVVAAREGLPGEPGGFLASPSLTTAELLGSRLSGRDPQTQLLAVTGLFPQYDTRSIQLARFGEACHRQ